MSETIVEVNYPNPVVVPEETYTVTLTRDQVVLLVTLLGPLPGKGVGWSLYAPLVDAGRRTGALNADVFDARRKYLSTAPVFSERGKARFLAED